MADVGVRRGRQPPIWEPNFLMGAPGGFALVSYQDDRVLPPISKIGASLPTQCEDDHRGAQIFYLPSPRGPHR